MTLSENLMLLKGRMDLILMESVALDAFRVELKTGLNHSL